MTQESPPISVGLALCVQDGTTWVWTPDRRLCIICGRAPDYTIPVESAGGEQPAPGVADGAGQSPPASPAVYTANCPLCGEAVELHISPDNISLVPPPGAAAPVEPAAAESTLPAADSAAAGNEHTASLDQPPAGALTEGVGVTHHVETQEFTPE